MFKSLRRMPAILTVLLPTAVFASEQATKSAIVFQLNNTQQVESACRMSLMLVNKTGTEITDMAVDLILIDAEGGVGDLLTLESGRLPKGKTRVQQYDLPQTSCDSISSVLVNDVSLCEGKGLEPTTCLDLLSINSRIATKLIL
ncbi:hypothetical protein [Polycladidibacter stylochi]|uniref:hypothetical protein n=1 Tax=Polycladidibacter stylochi TaxID=1807766 RepID=UPI0008360AA7|nr:hypothetical protein [Pseudovibrio stylochi]